MPTFKITVAHDGWYGTSEPKDFQYRVKCESIDEAWRRAHRLNAEHEGIGVTVEEVEGEE